MQLFFFFFTLSLLLLAVSAAKIKFELADDVDPGGEYVEIEFDKKSDLDCLFPVNKATYNKAHIKKVFKDKFFTKCIRNGKKLFCLTDPDELADDTKTFTVEVKHECGKGEEEFDFLEPSLSSVSYNRAANVISLEGNYFGVEEDDVSVKLDSGKIVCGVQEVEDEENKDKKGDTEDEGEDTIECKPASVLAFGTHSIVVSVAGRTSNTLSFNVPVPPTFSPTARPTATPTAQPTPRPTNVGETNPPTAQPTATPTARPTATPTAQPTPRPTNVGETNPPTAQPTATPTAQPTATPTAQPTPTPTTM